jgi:hypothetical protein
MKVIKAKVRKEMENSRITGPKEVVEMTNKGIAFHDTKAV